MPFETRLKLKDNLANYPNLVDLVNRGVLDIRKHHSRYGLFENSKNLKIGGSQAPLFLFEEDGSLSSKEFGLNTYTPKIKCADSEANSFGEKDDKAYIFLCNRFKRPTGHSFIYVYFPNSPENSRLISFQAFASRMDFAQRVSSSRGIVVLGNDCPDSAEFKISSAVGYPVDEFQARTLLANTYIDMLHGGIDYQVVNLGGGFGRFNCSGYAVNSLTKVGVNVASLSGNNVEEKCNKLPEFFLTIPPAISYSVRMEFKEMSEALYSGKITSPDSSTSCAFMGRDDGLVLLNTIYDREVNTSFFGDKSKYLNLDIREIIAGLSKNQVFNSNIKNSNIVWDLTPPNDRSQSIMR